MLIQLNSLYFRIRGARSIMVKIRDKGKLFKNFRVPSGIIIYMICAVLGGANVSRIIYVHICQRQPKVPQVLCKNIINK